MILLPLHISSATPFVNNICLKLLFHKHQIRYLIDNETRKVLISWKSVGLLGLFVPEDHSPSRLLQTGVWALEEGYAGV